MGVVVSALVWAGTGFALHSPDPPPPMGLNAYRTAIHRQHDYTNRALKNRCLERVSLDDFTKTPLKSVRPRWRDDHVYYAQRRHARAQSRPSSCAAARLMDWYYASGAKCVHEHEGAWNDPGAPYYGGFQADVSFQTSYNPGAYATWGTADRWPIIEQIEMAYNGWMARGWSPWPNTAAACGLL